MNTTMNAFLVESFWVLLALLTGVYDWLKDKTIA